MIQLYPDSSDLMIIKYKYSNGEETLLVLKPIL